MEAKNILYLFTFEFPFGIREQYLEQEIEYLEKEYNLIKIFPHTENGKLRKISNKVQVELFPSGNKRIKKNVAREFNYLKIYFKEFWFSKRKFKHLTTLRTQRAIFKHAWLLAEFIQSKNIDRSSIYYSFWMNDWALALAILHKRGIIDNFQFRVNGFDIYDERSTFGFIPFRNFIYSRCNKIYTVSDSARNYIISKYAYSSKILTSYFGTKDFGISKFDFSNEFRIYSCSRLVPLKNVVQLAKFIAELNFPIKWLHNGGGEELDEILKITNNFPAHITFVQHNMIEDHDEVIENEKQFSPHVFVSLSMSEGLPVTFIEAISLGIPILSTDVGGCSEIINDTTGILLPKEYTKADFFAAIHKIKSNEWQNPERRIAIRKIWESNFSAMNNYPKFAKMLRIN